MPQDGTEFTPSSFNEVHEFSVLSPCLQKDSSLKKAIRSFQEYLEDDKPSSRTHFSPLFVPPASRPKPKPSMLESLGMAQLLDHSMGALELWFELAEHASQLLEERAGLGEERFLLRFALANALVLAALCAAALLAALAVRAFLGRILAAAFFLLLVRAWAAREADA